MKNACLLATVVLISGLLLVSAYADSSEDKLAFSGDFDKIISFHAAEGGKKDWDAIIRIIDAHISLHKKMARLAKAAFGEKDERVTRANEKAEKFQSLKEKASKFISA